MRLELLRILRCPQSGQPLRLLDGAGPDGRIETGSLASEDGQWRYPIRGFIPRFVPDSGYADNFGMQWNKFRRTQLDSFSGHPISAGRFWQATAWNPTQLKARRVLDVGCGAGRFAEIAVAAGAELVALDYSSAVDACYANLRHAQNVDVVQGDIFALPFEPACFEFVYSLGVLQHTPNVARAFAALPSMVAPGGRLCVDVYERSWRSALLPKYWLRPFTKRVPKDRLFAILQHAVPRLLPVSRTIGAIPAIGALLQRAVPVANYTNELPLDPKQQLEWSLLDTFDWLAPQFDNPQTPAALSSWFAAAQMQAVEIVRAGHLVGRGVKPERSHAVDE